MKNSTHLSILSDLESRSNTESCQVTISVQLVSFKANGYPIEKSVTKTIHWPFNIFIPNMVSWKVKSENEFVENRNKIEQTGGQCSKYHSKQRDQSPLIGILDISICSNEIYDQEMSITPAVIHFGTTCITRAVRNLQVSHWTCKETVQLNGLRPVHLTA